MQVDVRTLELGTLYRSYDLDRGKVDVDKRTVELSFSSESPVERSFGYEILDHSERSVSMDRVKNGAPLLVEHDKRDQVGVVEKAWIEDKRGRAIVRFGNSARANEIFQDVKDGIRRLVSVGYRVYEMVTEKVEKRVETLRAMRWEPHEISIVSIPADLAVGVGRSNTADQTNKIKLSSTMPDEPKTETKPKGDDLDDALRGINEIELNEAKKTAQDLLRTELKEVNAVAAKMRKRYPAIDQWVGRYVDGEINYQQFRERAKELLDRTETSQEVTVVKPGEQPKEHRIGMSQRDLSRYSWRNAIMCAHDPDRDGFERDLSEEAIRVHKLDQRGPNSIIVPFDVLEWRNGRMSQRDQLVGTGSLGGNVVETSLLAGSFIDILRNRMLVARAGATMLAGLQGNVAIPRQSGAAATTWATSEAHATSEASVTFDQVTLTPKQISSRVDYSWLLLKQSNPSVDGLIQRDFQAVIARAIDLAALHGIGSSGQPTGIAATSGIGSVTAGNGTNGGDPAWATIVGLETEVAIDNADIGSLAYISNAKVRGKLKRTLKGGTAATDGIYIWPEGPINDGFALLNGYRIGTTNQVASNLTKGSHTTVCSAIFFGNWADLLIGMWSGLELLTNPYTQAANRVIETYAYQAVDIAVRHPESFAACLDATTT